MSRNKNFIVSSVILNNRQFTLQIWPLTLTFDLDHKLYAWSPLIFPISAYISKFFLLRQKLSDIAFFDDTFRRWTTYRPADIKTKVLFRIWHQLFKRRSSYRTFWFWYGLSTTDITDFAILWNIVNLRYIFDLWPWPLTLTRNFTVNYRYGSHLGYACKV